MVVAYRKAPLIELIVQVQWQVQTLQVPGGPAIVTDSSAEFDRWFQQLTERLREEGFHELERVVPHDVPPIAGQVVYRFRRGPDQRFPVIQFGHGVFTVNAGPPDYRSWASFQPQVEKALSLLLASRPRNSKVTKFNSLSLRYLDCFNEDLRKRASNFAFIRNDLGISIHLPDGLLDMASSLDQVHPTLALRLPLKGDRNASLNFQITAGGFPGTKGWNTIMDMIYRYDDPVDLEVQSVCTFLQRGHEIVHHWFETLISGIRDRLEPEEIEGEQ